MQRFTQLYLELDRTTRTGEKLDALRRYFKTTPPRDAIWALTGLVRVWVRKPGEAEAEAVPLEPPATVADVAAAIHHELGRTCVGARVWGPSARFEAQRVGRGHVVAAGDVVEVLTR